MSPFVSPPDLGLQCIVVLRHPPVLDLAGSGRCEAALTEANALGPKGPARSRGWDWLGWKMDALAIFHDPSVVVVDRGYPVFPEERCTQYRVVPIDIRDIEIRTDVYRSEFDRDPCSIVDFGA